MSVSAALILPATANAETVPLSELLVDARIESSVPSGGIDWSTFDRLNAGLTADPERGRAWGVGPESRVKLYMPDETVLLLSGRPLLYHGSRVQTVELLVNGAHVRTLRLVPWHRTYRVRLPPRALTATTVDLTLRYRWTARPTEVLQSADDDRPLAVEWSRIAFRTTGPVTPTSIEADGDDVVLRGSGRIRIPIKADRPVSFDVESIHARHSDGLRVSLDATDEDVVHRQWDSQIVPAGLGGGTERTDRYLRLTLQADSPGWLQRLLAFGRRQEVRLEGARIEAPKVTWPSRDLSRMGHFTAGDAEPGAAPRLVVIWVVDTLRPDHLGLYGYSRPTSPELDRFAADAVTFDRAVAQSSWTRPSVTSILTGQLLRRHGVYGKDDALPKDAVPLAELIYDQGYETVAVITNGNLRHVGLEQGFATFDHAKEGRIREFHRPAQRVLDSALEWIDENPGRPAFLYLHVTDPHLPYVPTSEFAERWPVADPSVGTIDGFAIATGSDSPPTQDLIDLYDAEIRQADAAFGALLGGLKRRGLYERAMILFTADHGEEFLDHGGWQHGRSLFAENIFLPLVIRWPPVASPYPPGSRVDEVASHADLAPTVLAAVGSTPPAAMQGRDLAAPGSRPTLAELHNLYRATVDERFKLVTDLQGNPLGLYDSITDPHDRVDLTLERPTVVEYHRRLQALFLERSAGGLGAASAEQDAETLEQLRALGYVN